MTRIKYTLEVAKISGFSEYKDRETSLIYAINDSGDHEVSVSRSF
mgnify:CR=1 FL=1